MYILSLSWFMLHSCCCLTETLTLYRSGALISAEGGIHRHTLRCRSAVTVLILDRDRMHYFSINNPGVFLSIHDLMFVA
jgi:hypothetical protein